MSFRPRLLAILVFLFVWAASPASAQVSAEELLQSALYKQQVEGDLQGAIELLTAIADHPDSDRTAAARALLQLGLAYETLGSPEAARSYRDVLAIYPDQTEVTGRARERLASLAPRAADRMASADGLSASRLWDSTSDWAYPGAVSPDGREVAAVHWLTNRPGNTGDLIVTPVGGGTHRVVGETEAATREASTDTYVLGSSWSRDGTRIAYSEWDIGWEHQVLHVVNADGSEDRVVSDNNQSVQLRPRDWSRDGSWLVALVVGWDGVARIVTISTEDGAVRVLKTLRRGMSYEDRHDTALSLSPDDRFVAYAYPPTQGAAPEVHVLAVDGSGESIVAPSGAIERNPLWTPDGERLVFLSDRSGTADLWAVEMSHGSAVGDPVAVRPHLGPVVPLGFTNDGVLTYRIEVPQSEQRIVELADGDAMFEQDVALTDRFVGYNRYPAWSPDGSRVAYIATRAESALKARSYLVVRTLADRKETDIELSGMALNGNLTRPKWSEDGRAVLLPAYHLERSDNGVTAPYAGYHIDVGTGEVRRERHPWSFASPSDHVTGRQASALREVGIRISGGPQFHVGAMQDGVDALRDGESLLLIDRGGMAWLRALSCDPSRTYEGAVCVDRDAEPFLVEPVVGAPGTATLAGWALSPNGTRIAYMQRDLADGTRTLMVRSVTLTDEPAVLHQEIPAGCTCPIRWTPDERHLIYATTSGREPSVIYRVAVDGGEPELVDWPIQDRQLDQMSFDPQGMRAVIPTGIQESRREVWALSGFPWDGTGRE